MQSLIGFVLLLVLIYVAYLFFHPNPEIPGVQEAVQDVTAMFDDLPGDGNPPPSKAGTKIKERESVTYQEDTFAEDTIEEDKGFFSGTMDYLASALSSYKALLDLDSKKKRNNTLWEKGSSSEKDSSEALLIYKDILDIKSTRGAKRE